LKGILVLSLSALAAVASVLACLLLLFGLVTRPKAAGANPEWLAKLMAVEQVVKDLPTTSREEGKHLREEVSNVLGNQGQGLDTRLATFADSQTAQLSGMRQEASDGRAKLEEALKLANESFAQVQTSRLGETNASMRELAEKQEKALADVALKIQGLTEANDKKQVEIREALTTKLDQLRLENETKLEQMRLTVDEKLQGTLEKRLGESFQLVSSQLEMVHKGLGEMQGLATGVGDLKRVLTNVKARGGWGEMQLGALLEDILTPEQFGRNVRVRPDSGEVVEFAVRFPGRNDDGVPLYVPIDSKFPQEDYDRLLTAQESALVDEIEKAGAALERAIRLQAKTISEKYVHPPYTTDFAILYLPTEGLYAEIIRRPGLASEMQSNHRIMVASPTTLGAYINSLQMGFRTLAIEKRSSEVWQVLAAAKAEFSKYGEVWDKLGKQLATAQNTVVEAGRRTRAVERQLRNVETLDLPAVDPLLLLPGCELDSDAVAPDDDTIAAIGS
jgi:DNA recombination protein RmuC